MIEEYSEIKELYDLKHRNDNEIHTHYDYETNLIRKMFSKYIYSNDNMNTMLGFLKQQWIWMIESVLPVKNFYNYTVGKYWNKHNS